MSYDITKVDKNFIVKDKIDKEDVKLYNVNEAPFKVYGVQYLDGCFRRLDEEVAKSVSEGVHAHHKHAAGGRIRFKTNSPYIAIYVKLANAAKMPHFAFTGSIGMDLYIKVNGKERYVNTFVPKLEIREEFVSVLNIGFAGMNEYTINLPLYSGVKEMYIGLAENTTVLEAEPYKYEKPIVFYGSSITQGGCASRPGNCYTSMVSRRLNANHINLGFSGNAKGEDAIAEYIAGLDMSVFVYDYDHNAPTVEHLSATHERMFKIIREKNPDLPILIMSRPRYVWDEAITQRYEVVKNTFENAKANGDNNVYLLGGKELSAACKNEGSVDNCHPNDWGFAAMADAVYNVLKDVLK